MIAAKIKTHKMLEIPSPVRTASLFTTQSPTKLTAKKINAQSLSSFNLKQLFSTTCGVNVTINVRTNPAIIAAIDEETLSLPKTTLPAKTAADTKITTVFATQKLKKFTSCF